MRWIKTEERLPKKSDNYFTKKTIGSTYIGDWDYFDGEKFEFFEYGEVIEWLDEDDTSDLEAAFNAARETVVLHHYNGDDRTPINVDKYEKLSDYLNNNPKIGN